MMRPLNRALWNVINGEEDFCRLCFESVSAEASSMSDAFVISSDKTEDIIDILAVVLGIKITDTFAPFDRICEECMKMALRSYRFITMCRDNNNTLTNAIDCITPSLNNGDGANCCKSLFLSINLGTSSTTLYYNYKTCPSTKHQILRQFKKLINPRRRIQNTVHENVDDFIQDSSDTDYLPLPLSGNEVYTVLKTGDNLKRYHCNKCRKGFTKLYLVERHYENVHEKSTNYRNPAVVQYHQSWVCASCGKVFELQSRLRQHERIHAKPKQCPKCKRCYKNPHYFKKHHVCAIGERPKLEKNLECDHCEKRYASKIALSQHLKFEHGDGIPHICKWCNKKFYFAAALKGHIVKHTKEKNFKCEICDGRFVTKPSLTYHMRIHTGEKPYKCKICDEYFLSSSRRSDHMRLKHLGPSVPCPVCGKLFKSHTNMRDHKKLHFNPKSSLYTGRKIKLATLTFSAHAQN